MSEMLPSLWVPWLVVMDGLERVLLAHNRLDAAELKDEDVNQPTDAIAGRDPRSAIRTEDDDLLWLALGEHENAKAHALAAYCWYWADDEPYVFRFELERTKAILATLDVESPSLPPYDPAKDGKYLLEDEINAAIEKLRTEKAAERSMTITTKNDEDDASQE